MCLVNIVYRIHDGLPLPVKHEPLYLLPHVLGRAWRKRRQQQRHVGCRLVGPVKELAKRSVWPAMVSVSVSRSANLVALSSIQVKMKAPAAPSGPLQVMVAERLKYRLARNLRTPVCPSLIKASSHGPWVL
jgi:hypothetical protein